MRAGKAQPGQRARQSIRTGAMACPQKSRCRFAHRILRLVVAPLPGRQGIHFGIWICQLSPVAQEPDSVPDDVPDSTWASTPALKVPLPPWYRTSQFGR